ncbi:unnamed protein product [Ophioblennius macclurei]
MASAFDTDPDSSSSEDSDATRDSDGDDSPPLPRALSQGVPRQACRYYNSSGGCRDGANCRYPHVCKYHLQGNCRHGNTCRLSHSVGGGGGRGGGVHPPPSNADQLSDGRSFQWQLKADGRWMDILNDHVIEAQYSLPHSKSIKLYNTPYGAVSIDFSHVRVIGKNLQVRRLDDGKSHWSWFCILRRKWIKYGEKDSKGNSGPVSSSDIERRFQTNPSGSFSFSVGGTTVEIRFPEMLQTSQSRKRRVTRRPQYRPKRSRGGNLLTPPIGGLSLGSRPQWQFQGDRGAWHDFKVGSAHCSVTSDDIETRYQQNPGGSLNFSASGQNYCLDLAAKIQTNLKTQRTRKIRRVMV